MRHLCTLLSIALLVLFGSVYSIHAHAGRQALWSNISFTENAGQVIDTEGKTRRDIAFTTRTENMALYFTDRGVSYVFRQDISSPNIPNSSVHPIHVEKVSADQILYRMDMELLGINPDATIQAEDQISSYSNYYYAHCADGLHGVRSWRRLIYRNVYNNIDLVFYGIGAKLKYDFIVRPGGNVEDIRLRYTGARQLGTTGDTLIAGTPLGSLREGKLVTYQDGGRPVESRYEVEGEMVGFHVGMYDRSRELTIDPEVHWATYLGDSEDDGASFGLAVDRSNDIIVSGETYSFGFPVTAGALQTVHGGQSDVFVAKFSNDGVLLWSTYYGGSSVDGLEKNGSLVVSGEDYVIIGTTFSSDFPVSNGALQTIYAGQADGFILKLNRQGQRVWSTYYGGSGKDETIAIAADSTGNIVFTGRTNSGDYPVTPGAFQQSHGGAASNAFLVKLTGSGTREWATYYGGSGVLHDYGFDVACSRTGDVVLTGHAGSSDFPVSTNAFQRTNAGSYDMFAARFDPDGRMRWSTLYGGDNSDQGNGIAVDEGGNVYMTGTARSANFPVSSNAWQPNLAGTEYNIGIVKFDADGMMLWSTYYGGTGGGRDGDGSYRLVLDSKGNMAIVGTTTSLDFPVTDDALQKNYGGGNYDGFILLMNTSGVPVWSTYYGGSFTDYMRTAAFDAQSNLVVSGYTQSQNLPTTDNAFQKLYGGGQHDGFIVKFGGCSFSGLDIVVESNPVEIDSGAVDLLRCRRITIRNNSGNEQQLTKGWFENNTCFSFPQGQLPLLIPAGEQIDAMVCFVPDSIGEFRDTLVLSNDCGSLRTAVYSIVGSPVGSVYSVESGCGIPVRLQVRDWKKPYTLPFPQPASDVVYVPVNAGTADNSIRSTLLTLTGIPVAEGTWFPGEQIVEFDVSNLRTGVYAVCVRGESWQKYYTIVVE